MNKRSDMHSFQPPAGETSLRSFFNSIKGKIFIVFAVTLTSVCALTMLNFWSLTTVKNRLLLGERYDDLLNNILEARRFEKNFLFFGDTESLQEGIDYLVRVDALVAELADDIINVSGERTFRIFVGTLRDYEKTMAGYAESAASSSPNRPEPEEIRTRGKALVDYADTLIRTKRERIHRTILRTSVLPFAFLGVFLLLVVLVIKLISKWLLQPLDVVKRTTERVARGDFSPIARDARQIEEIEGLIGAFNRMARELETNQEDLLQARKIAALGTFTAGIAHELNNPINNISLTAETFMETHGEGLDTDGSEMIGDILAQADRASDIVRNLLDFSRTERPAFSRLKPAEIVRSTVALVRNQVMLAGVRLQTDVPEDIPEVQGDLRGLQQVFMNLLLNAMQATPSGGLIEVTASDGAGDHVRFEVRDSGHGMAPEVLEHIFEPFYTSKEVGKGTGLGLAVTYSIVKRHGGRIEVQSSPGQGSVFTVFIPRAQGPEPARNGRARQEDATQTGHSR